MAIFITLIKVILCLLLVLIALVLISAGLILFVPVRYHIDGKYECETGAACAEAKWLLGLLSARAGYNRDDGAEAYINVCGFKVYDILGRDKDAKEDADDEICESYVQAADSVDAETGSDKYVANGVGEIGKTSAMAEGESVDAAALSDASSCDNENGSTTDGIGITQTAARPKVQVYKSHGVSTGWHERLLELIRRVTQWITAPISAARGLLRDLSDRISGCIDHAESKLRDIWQNIRETAIAIKGAFDKRSTQIRKLKKLWDDKRFDKGKTLLIERIKRLSSELKPRAGSGRIRIGRDDPYETGQMMQAAAFLYPLYGDRIEVVPDFDNAVIEGRIDVRGRLRLIIAAEAAFRLFFNRELRAMYRQARHILELE